MGEKLFELLVITIAGGIFVAGIGAYLSDGLMPTRRRIGLLLSALAMTIGVCVYYKVAGMPWWGITSVVCFCAGVLVGIFKSFLEGSAKPLLIALGAIPAGLGVAALAMVCWGLERLNLYLLEEPYYKPQIEPESIPEAIAFTVGLWGLVIALVYLADLPDS